MVMRGSWISNGFFDGFGATAFTSITRGLAGGFGAGATGLAGPACAAGAAVEGPYCKVFAGLGCSFLCGSRECRAGPRRDPAFVRLLVSPLGPPRRSMPELLPVHARYLQLSVSRALGRSRVFACVTMSVLLILYIDWRNRSVISIFSVATSAIITWRASQTYCTTQPVQNLCKEICG